jgi:hypothetical protein
MSPDVAGACLWPVDWSAGVSWLLVFAAVLTGLMDCDVDGNMDRLRPTLFATKEH